MPSPNLICTQAKQIVNYLVEVGLSSDQNYPFVRKGRNKVIPNNETTR